MRYSLIAVAMLLGTLPLGACATGPQEVAYSTPTVSYRVLPGDERLAEDKARDFCGRYRSDPVLVDTVRQGREWVATFECR